jgi:hypothetical protein
MAASPPRALASDLRLAAPDDFYAALVKAYEGLSEADCALFNARLILLLANQVGDQATLEAAIAAARAGVTRPA